MFSENILFYGDLVIMWVLYIDRRLIDVEHPQTFMFNNPFLVETVYFEVPEHLV